ncbi:glycoside hydrolase family 127 protein [Planctomonas sp. JC2975]|uniref:glycoside hydrolase family 127 protein n=1 Tax=Planctomonas sp. JC2975 TaxID=2729626 RepID=UPI00147487C3|nr:beta-L-arabinofuranosidase domain-containing protein [Planctomonas sp. JC2975]NNC13736.1 glycoside hydrolase family 127 protein [Planctomonas sp. JC2975]
MTLTSPSRRVTTPVTPANPSHGALRPLGLSEVQITGGFWSRMQSVNADGTLPHIAHWLEREGWLGNFDLAATGSLTPENRRGREFSDSEVYKYLEAVSWQLGEHRDDKLEKHFRSVVSRVAAAQEPDGYVNTRFGRPGQQARWSDLAWGHELYCAGHLFQAAVARIRTKPDADDGLAQVATRLADLICEVFGVDGIQSVCGHAEVETGLVELGRATGSDKYIEQARIFIERRGTGVLPDIEFGRAYYQDDIPVRDADVLRGHAVRANYLASGAVDVAIETADGVLLDSLTRQWQNTVARRTYITGGQGSHHQDEAFGEDFELPPDRAYSETCASVASIQFSWRLLLAHGDSKYADLIERTLYNVVATSPAADGRSFYYANTLHCRVPGEPADPDAVSPRAEASLRAPWFTVTCCPPNVARTLASLDAYVATASAEGIQIHQYAPAKIATTLDDGESIELSIETDYPTTGAVTIRPLRDASKPWTLQLRVPAWANGSSLTVNGGVVPAEPGYVTHRRQFRAGDEIVLDLPIEPRLSEPDRRIDAVRGAVAVERGPVVYALESVDLPDGWGDVSNIVIDTSVAPQDQGERVVVQLARSIAGEKPWPYNTSDPSHETHSSLVPLIAYHDWAERGPSTMRIWLPTL